MVGFDKDGTCMVWFELDCSGRERLEMSLDEYFAAANHCSTVQELRAHLLAKAGDIRYQRARKAAGA